MHLRHDDGSLADRRRHPLDRPASDVADGEHTGPGRLVRLWRTLERPAIRSRRRLPGEHEAEGSRPTDSGSQPVRGCAPIITNSAVGPQRLFGSPVVRLRRP